MTVKLNNDFEILTPNGWKDFKGISKTQNKKDRLKITFEDNSSVISSNDHPFYINNKIVLAKDITVNNYLDHHIENKKVKHIERLSNDYLYDIIEVSDGHRFMINDGLITKNCDELSFLRPSIQQEFWSAVRPTLSSSGGASILTSTPGQDDDLFATIWRAANDTILPNGEESEVGKNGYRANFADWTYRPDRDEKWAEEEKAAMGEEKFLREHLNRFISFKTTLIDSMVLSTLTEKEPILRMGDVRWYKRIDPTCSYYVVLDPSLGTKQDWSAIQVVEMPTLEQVGEWSSNTVPPKEQVQVLYDILQFIKYEMGYDEYDEDVPIFWSFENNSIGEAVLQTIEDSGIDMFPGYLISEKRKGNTNKRFRRGINTTAKNKVLACSKFKSLVDTGKLKPRSAGVIKQLKNFTAKGASFAAMSGNDDLVMALIMCIRIIEMTKDWEIYDPDILTEKIETEFSEPMGFVI